MLGGKELFERGTFAQKEEVEDENKFPCIKINYSKCVSVRRRSLKWCNKNALNTRWSRISEEHLSCKSKFPAGWHCTKCLWSKQLKSQFAILDFVSNEMVCVWPLRVPEFMLEMNPILNEVSHDIFKALLIFSCANSSFLLVFAWLQKMCYFKREKKFQNATEPMNVRKLWWESEIKRFWKCCMHLILPTK